MTPLDATWHILNALAAPFWVAALAVAGLKWLWRHDTSHLGWIHLLGWAYGAALTAYGGAWTYLGAEGTMVGYALMVGATAVALWLRAFAFARS